jgi:hypothetical protein
MQQASGVGSQVSNKATDIASYIRESILNLTTSTEYRELVMEFLSLFQSLMGQVEETVTDLQKNPDKAAQKLTSKIQKTLSEDEQL